MFSSKRFDQQIEENLLKIFKKENILCFSTFFEKNERNEVRKKEKERSTYEKEKNCYDPKQ